MSDSVNKRFFLGLDLGQANDFTALCVVEWRESKAWPDYKPEVAYHLRFLHRYNLGTTYLSIADDIAKKMDHKEINLTGCHKPVLVADITGVGRPVFEMLKAKGLDPYGISITGGREVTRNTMDPLCFNVPKRDLAVALQVAFQNKRIKMAANLPLIDVFKKELLNFEVKISKSGQDTYESFREGTHDDLVLAVAMPIWLCERGQDVKVQLEPTKARKVVKSDRWGGYV